MKKGQSGLEYLIIAAAVLIIAGVAMIVVSGSIGGSKNSLLHSECQAAATQCYSLKEADPSLTALAVKMLVLIQQQMRKYSQVLLTAAKQESTILFMKELLAVQ